AATVPAERVAEVVNISADLGRHAEWLAGYAELGFDEIYLHHVGQEQTDFVEAFGARVLPELRAS
ncbi:MAG TPA: LLM class F420-dependent oxidoreductase, partial [Micromonospora sp.]